MQKIMTLVTVITYITMFGHSCKKPDKHLFSGLKCDLIKISDTQSMAKILVGNWKWNQSMSIWTGNWTIAAKQIVLSIGEDKSYVLKENDSIFDSGIIHFSVDSSKYITISTSGSNQYIYRNPYFCDNMVIFDDNPYDGGCHLFKRY